MKSTMLRQFINSRKFTTKDRENQELSVAFLRGKYEAARMFFIVIKHLKLISGPEWSLTGPFGVFYHADKLTQRTTFGKYDGTKPERGSKFPDPNSTCPVPTWFSGLANVD